MKKPNLILLSLFVVSLFMIGLLFNGTKTYAEPGNLPLNTQTGLPTTSPAPVGNQQPNNQTGLPESGSSCTPGQDFATSPAQQVSGSTANQYYDAKTAPTCTGFNNDAKINLVKKTDTCTGDFSYNCIVLDPGTNPSAGGPQSGQGDGNNQSSTPNTGSQTTPTTQVTQTQNQGNKTNANSTEAQFTNLCSSGDVACSGSASCNSLYDNAVCSASCNPDQKYCDGQGTNHVYKWVCDGKNQECGNGIGGNATLLTQSTSRVDLTSGVSCGKTVQLDVFDKQCDAGGGWNCNANDLKGYMTYYTGSCSSSSTPPSANGNACTPNSQYTNICSSGYVSCSTSSSCNSLYNSSQCPASCNPDTQSCDGQGTNYVYKWVCNGNDKECGGNGAAPIVPPVVSQGQQNIAAGLTCGQTAQLDVYDKQCDAGGGWNCDGNNLKGYLVYYSGDCSSASSCQTPTGTPSASLTPTTPASPSATPTGPACGTACTTSADCVQSPTNSCTTCVNGTCQAPTPTPTPSFNPAACKCAGTTISSIVPGGQVTVNSTYQVLGADQSTAKVNSVSFFLVKGDNTTGDTLQKSDPIPATVGSISSEGGTKYNATWNFTMPTNVDPNAVYRVFTQDDCQAQTGTSPQANAQNVQVASVQNNTPIQTQQKQGFFAAIINFFRSLIGQRDTRTITTKPTLTPTPTTTDNKKSKQNLQLDTLPVAKMLPQTACTVVRFQFPQSVSTEK